MEDNARFKRKLALLHGELLGTQVLLRGVILAHRDPPGCIEIAMGMHEAFLATGLTKNVSEDLLEGFAAATKKVLPSRKDLRRTGHE